MRRAFLALVFGLATAAQAVTTGPTRPAAASYPASCVSSPLTDLPSGPVYAQSTMLASAAVDTGGSQGFEPVTFTFWRVACDGGKSALLLRIARASDANPARVAVFPFQYGLFATQGTLSGSLRLAPEPNTLTANLPINARIFSSVTLVVENAPLGDGFPTVLVPPPLPIGVIPQPFDFNQALAVRIPTPSADGINPLPPPVTLSIPAYDASQYPAARAALPVSGYNAGNYFDSAHSGEGIVIDVADASANALTLQRALNVAWYTYDTSGNPFWIFGTAPFVAGDSSVTVPMLHLSNGGFAGSFGASASAAPWGTVTISFPDCATLHLAYASVSGLAAPIPSGSGERAWSRLTQENGLYCR